MAAKADLPSELGKDVTRLGLVFVALAASGILGVFLFNRSALGAELLLAVASALLGGVVGFIFAVPRSRRGQNDGQLSAARDGKVSDYTANTNLEQISDWLTKILVGAGLVELKDLPGYVNRIAGSLSPAIGPAPSARPIVVCLILCFGAWGFLLAYLLIRLWLPKALVRAEHEDQVQKQAIEDEAELRNTERMTYDYLYRDPPQGFEQAIATVRGYLQKPAARKSAWLWTYLAAAYGQKYSFDKRAGKDADSLQQVRNLAVESVEKAVSLDPGSKPILARLYRGADPNEADLAELQGDEALDRLLGG